MSFTCTRQGSHRFTLGVVIVALPTFLPTFWATSARAQVNTETLRPKAATAGLTLGVDASLGIAKGNVDFLDVGATVRLAYEVLRPDRGSGAPPFSAQRFFIVANGRYAERTALGETEAKPFISQTFAHARWTSMWRERFGTEVFAQAQTNEFLRLRARLLAGTGVRVELLRREGLQMWGGTGTMLEHNRIDVAPGAPDPETELVHRSTSYLAVRAEPLPKVVALQLTGYMQPAWKRPRDLRALVEFEGLVKVTEVIALGQSLSLLYDNEPPTSVRSTDLRLVATLKLTL